MSDPTAPLCPACQEPAESQEYVPESRTITFDPTSKCLVFGGESYACAKPARESNAPYLQDVRLRKRASTVERHGADWVEAEWAAGRPVVQESFDIGRKLRVPANARMYGCYVEALPGTETGFEFTPGANVDFRDNIVFSGGRQIVTVDMRFGRDAAAEYARLVERTPGLQAP